MYFPVSRGSTKSCRLAWATVSQITGALFRCRRYVTAPGRTPISGMAYFCFNLGLTGMPIRRTVLSLRLYGKGRNARETISKLPHIFLKCHVFAKKKSTLQFLKFSKDERRDKSCVWKNGAKHIVRISKISGENGRKVLGYRCVLNKLPTMVVCRSARVLRARTNVVCGRLYSETRRSFVFG